MAFAFDLKQPVKLASGEAGHVIGRAEYADGEPTYQVRFVAADGCLSEAWWPVTSIEAAATAVESESA